MPDGDSPIGFGRIGLPYHLISELVFLLYGPMKYRIIFVKKVIDIGLGLKSKRPAWPIFARSHGEDERKALANFGGRAEGDPRGQSPSAQNGRQEFNEGLSQPRRHVFRANPHATVPRDLPLLRHGPVFQPSPTQPSAACFWAGRHANTESLKFPFFRASGHCFGPLPQGRRYPSPLPRWPKKPAPIGPPRMTASSTLNRSPIIARPCLSATAPTAPIASQSGR
jgi:hypothetical protein